LNTPSTKTTVTRLIQLTLLVSACAFLSCQKQPPASAEKHPAPATTPAATPLTGPAGFPPPVINKPYPGTGVVDLINRKEGWIEITHEDIKDLMPAMQMEFNVKDKTLLDRIAVGDRVDFIIIETPKGEYLIDIKKKN
jgi:Cu/Ag efflux protein CusF